ncbi:putative fungal-specific transcription factor [Talaromyces proteolyticus]|uniref:Fungal-specific transcription factor n=1 Tax=Talaromyces proteolyticus TaxID=1131652 RepID=A0AAD4Q5U5_9EURO|nr:putative fungal-specific transcription factor [Talaromyces proteolyticus]KAH8704981.1 putative fungal-specific transcription factor [Talaromyces proteolyticus]
MSASQTATQPSRQGKKAPRKHVTTACVPCRESKIRCDGASPDCVNCQKKGKKCMYQHGDDKRKVSLRAATELFSARIDQLTQFIYDRGMEPPANDPEAEQEINRVLDTLRISRGAMRRHVPQLENHSPHTAVSNRSAHFDYPHASIPSVLPNWSSTYPTADTPRGVVPTPEQHLADGSNFTHAGFDFTLPTAECLDNLYANLQSPENPLADENPHSGAERPSLYLPGDAADTDSDSGDDPEHEVIEQLSSRIGTLKLASDGHLRYYGPTSNLNLVDVVATSDKRPGPDARSVRHDGQELLNHLRIGQHVEQSLEDHLIQLYFTWQNPSLYVVDWEMFASARAKWRNDLDDTPFFSEVLTNAMCALGAAFEARYHPTFITFPKSLSEFFADRAKALLEIELDCPCVATVQALVILSSHEAASNRDARGWLYSGMSMRLAFDLGLHLDMTPYVKKGKMTPLEAEVRKVAFWGSYVADHFWGFYLGRPFRMNAGDISVCKPASAIDRTREETWHAYGMGDSHLPALTTGLRSPSELITRQFANLWEMITPVGHILYGCHDIDRHDLQRITYQVTEDLFAWKSNLPSSLQIDLDHDTGPILPHLLMLHMQYHQILIFFHRPWVSKSYIQPQNPKQGPGYQHARRTCIESATSIARLLRLYEKYYTFRRINNQVVAIIFTAALILIFVTISMSSQTAGRFRLDDQWQQIDMVAHLNVCFRALDELGQSFENAKRTRDFLVSLQRRWQNHMRRSGMRSKRLHGKSTDGLTAGSANDPSAAAATVATGKKKPRLEGMELSLLGAPGHDLVDLGRIGLNWTPSSRDLKMLSDDLGGPLLSSDTAPFAATANTLSSLDEIAPAWWDSPPGASSGGGSNHNGNGLRDRKFNGM